MYESSDLKQQSNTVETHIDRAYQTAWIKFLHPGRPVMTTGLLGDFDAALDRVEDTMAEAKLWPNTQQIRYMVLSSAVEGVFSLGGDLEHFLDLISRGDREGLSNYAHACTNVLLRSLDVDDRRLCRIALVQGETLGGGFEAALAADVIVAEKRARFGFPETLFGMFPGMGAFSFLARKLSPAMAKRMMTSGKIYTAQELYDLGIVDLLADDGKGEEMVRHYIKRRQQRESGYEAIEAIMDQHNPVTQEELESIVDLWVETAFQLNKDNLDMMRYLLKAQTKRWGATQYTDVEERQVA